MAMKGWPRIGIIVSVIWFLGFGVLLWNQYVEDAVAPYARDLKTCSAIEQSSDEFWRANARNSEELSEKLRANKPDDLVWSVVGRGAHGDMMECHRLGVAVAHIELLPCHRHWHTSRGASHVTKNRAAWEIAARRPTFRSS
jgi:hypothetical protein